MEENIVFNSSNIMSDKLSSTWNALISDIKDPIIKRLYIKDISEKEIREDVLRKVASLSGQITKMPINFKLFVTHLSYDVYFGPEWFEMLVDYYSKQAAIPTSVMYPKLLGYASIKDISADTFFKIVNQSGEDFLIIEDNLINYNSLQCVETSLPTEEKDNTTTEATVFNALMKVLSVTDTYDETKEVDAINDMIAVQKTLTDNMTASIKTLTDIISKQKEDIKKISLTSAAKDEVVKTLQEQNAVQEAEISSLKEKIVAYEKKELSRVNLTHKLAEFSGLINEIDKSNIITAN